MQEREKNVKSAEKWFEPIGIMSDEKRRMLLLDKDIYRYIYICKNERRMEISGKVVREKGKMILINRNNV